MPRQLQWLSGNPVIIPGNSLYLERLGVKPGKYESIFMFPGFANAYPETQGNVTRWFLDVNGKKTPLYTVLPTGGKPCPTCPVK
jgi:hypothetical protein